MGESMDTEQLPACWRSALDSEFRAPYFETLRRFVEAERKTTEVFPAASQVFNAFRLTPLNSVRVLILGQDPYHDVGQAHGLSFSVQPGVRIPPSLRNIYKELNSDLQIETPVHGCLRSWAEHGVLLLNTVLTVRAHQANSHRRKGWEQFTDRVIEIVNEQPRVVFILWGRPAQKKEQLISDHHLVLKSAHPSPLSARRGFFGSQPFSKANDFLQQHELSPIDWSLPPTAPSTPAHS